jgi:hypothetical protein
MALSVARPGCIFYKYDLISFIYVLKLLFSIRDVDTLSGSGRSSCDELVRSRDDAMRVGSRGVTRPCRLPPRLSSELITESAPTLDFWSTLLDHLLFRFLLSSTPTIMPVGLEAWITQIPPVTRTWLALAVLTSLAVVRPFGQVQYAFTHV